MSLTSADFPRVLAAINRCQQAVEAAPLGWDNNDAHGPCLAAIHNAAEALRGMLCPSGCRTPDDGSSDIEGSELSPGVKEQLDRVWQRVADPFFMRMTLGARGRRELLAMFDDARRAVSTTAPVCRLAVRDGRIILDGREVVLEGTTDWRQDILAFFRALTAAPRGSWVSGNDISRDVRWKRKLDRAPYSLRMLVEPKDGTDHRLRAAAWRE